MKPKKTYLQINLVGKRVVVRPYEFSDFKLCKASHEGRLSKKNKYDGPILVGTETELKKFKERLLRQREYAKKHSCPIFGVFDKVSGAHVGQVDLFLINRQLRWGNLGYHVHNQYFGRGYAAEACRLALKAAFKILDFHRIEAAMELDNKASQKVAIRAGLKFEGKRKKFFPDNGGIDMNVYAANAIDYKFGR